MGSCEQLKMMVHDRPFDSCPHIEKKDSPYIKPGDTNIKIRINYIYVLLDNNNTVHLNTREIWNL